MTVLKVFTSPPLNFNAPEFCVKTPKLVFGKTFPDGPIKLTPEPVVLKKFAVAQFSNHTADANVLNVQVFKTSIFIVVVVAH